MAKYLDPKADLTFKKVFGEHKDLLISFLNALLPLDADGQITSIEYLPLEVVPRTPMLKDTIVDVRCRDQQKREFIVEMQMIWQAEFMKRVLFNASKAYAGQLGKGGDYGDLQPIYSLNLVNDKFRDDDDWYHDYGICDMKYAGEVIEGMHFVFIELPKFKPHTLTDRKMAALWLRFLTEIDERTRQAPAELLHNPETSKALQLVEESAYSEAQMNGYDQFWDRVSTERTFISAALKRGRAEGLAKGHAEGHAEGLAEGLAEGKAKGLAKGLAEGKAKGLAEGKAKGLAEGKAEVARKMLAMNMPVDTIASLTGLSAEEIKSLSH